MRVGRWGNKWTGKPTLYNARLPCVRSRVKVPHWTKLRVKITEENMLPLQQHLQMARRGWGQVPVGPASYVFSLVVGRGRKRTGIVIWTCVQNWRYLQNFLSKNCKLRNAVWPKSPAKGCEVRQNILVWINCYINAIVVNFFQQRSHRLSAFLFVCLNTELPVVLLQYYSHQEGPERSLN